MQLNGDYNVDGKLDVTGHLTLKATSKFFWDGPGVGGNTYTYESASDTLDTFVGGSLTYRGTLTQFVIGSSRDFVLNTGKKLFLDNGNNTYIIESAADTVDIFTNGTQGFQVTPTIVRIGSTRDLSLAVGKKLYLKEYSGAGSNSWISETVAGTVTMTITDFAAITFVLVPGVKVDITTYGDVTIQDGKRLNLSGDLGSYITHSSTTTQFYTNAGVTRNMKFIAGNVYFGPSDACDIRSDGQIRIAKVDPPLANYTNHYRASISAFLNYADDSADFSNSFNIDSLSDDDGDGFYDISYDWHMKTLNGYSAHLTSRNGTSQFAAFSGSGLSQTGATFTMSDNSGAATDGSFCFTAIGLVSGE